MFVALVCVGVWLTRQYGPVGAAWGLAIGNSILSQLQVHGVLETMPDMNSASKRSSTKTRVLVTTVSPEARGGIAALHDVLFEFPDLENFVLTPFPFSSPRPFAERFPARFVRVCKGLIRFVRQLRRDRSIGIVHINTAPDEKALLRDVLLIVLSRILRRKTVIQIHGAISEYPRSRVVRKIAQLAFSLCDRILVFSQKDEKRVKRSVEERKITRFPNGDSRGRVQRAGQLVQGGVLHPDGPPGRPLTSLVCSRRREHWISSTRFRGSSGTTTGSRSSSRAMDRSSTT